MLHEVSMKYYICLYNSIYITFNWYENSVKETAVTSTKRRQPQTKSLNPYSVMEALLFDSHMVEERCMPGPETETSSSINIYCVFYISLYITDSSICVFLFNRDLLFFLLQFNPEVTNIMKQSQHIISLCWTCQNSAIDLLPPSPLINPNKPPRIFIFCIPNWKWKKLPNYRTTPTQQTWLKIKLMHIFKL